MSEEKDAQYKAFVDILGRIIIGELIEETEETISVKNAVTTQVMPVQEQNQVSVGLIPLIFREIVGGKDINLTYKKCGILNPDIEIDAGLMDNYKKMFTPQVAPSIITPGGNEPVQLFES